MSPARMDRAEAAVRIVIDLTEAFRRRDTAAVLDCLSDDCRIEFFIAGQRIQGMPGENTMPGTGTGPGGSSKSANQPSADDRTIEGKAGAEEMCRRLFGSRPDLSLEVEEIFGIGFRCVLRWKCGWKGAAGTDKDYTDKAGTDNVLAGRPVRGAGIFKIKNGLICEALFYRM